MTALENKLFSASDRYHKKKIRKDELVQIHFRPMDLHVTLGLLLTQSSSDCE